MKRQHYPFLHICKFFGENESKDQPQRMILYMLMIINNVLIHLKSFDGLNCRLDHIYTMHIMEFKEKPGYMDRLLYRFLTEFLSPLPMIMTEALSLMTGTTKVLMNKLLACPPYLLFGLGSLR